MIVLGSLRSRVPRLSAKSEILIKTAMSSGFGNERSNQRRSLQVQKTRSHQHTIAEGMEDNTEMMIEAEVEFLVQRKEKKEEEEEKFKKQRQQEEAKVGVSQEECAMDRELKPTGTPTANSKQTLSAIVPRLNKPINDVYINTLSKLRMTEAENYLEDLNRSREHHPRLQNTDIFNRLSEDLLLANSQKCTFFSVDLEAFERNTKIITEIGVSIYDPVTEYNSMVPSTINIHIILEEHKRLRNGKFVQDNKNRFLGGQSLVMKTKEAVKLLKTLIEYYFIEREKQGYRAAVVGHSVAGDLKWLSNLGIKFPKQANILDTEKIYSYTFGKNGTGLGSCLRRFSISHTFLHNAGNDAYYTLILLLKLVNPLYRSDIRLDDFQEDEKYRATASDLKNHFAKAPYPRIDEPSKRPSKFKYYEILPQLWEPNYVSALKNIYKIE